MRRGEHADEAGRTAADIAVHIVGRVGGCDEEGVGSGDEVQGRLCEVWGVGKELWVRDLRDYVSGCDVFGAIT